MEIKTLKRLICFSKNYMFLFICALFFSFLSILFHLLTPIYIGQAVDYLVCLKFDLNILFIKLFKIGICVILGCVFEWILMRVSNAITYAITRDLRANLFEKYCTLPISYIDSHAHGDLLNRMINDIDLVGDGLLQGITHLLSALATIIGTICFMLYMNGTVAVIVIVLTPLSLVVASFIAHHTYKYFQEQLAIRSELGAYVEEMISHQKTVKTFGYEQENQNNFEEINQRLYISGVKSQFLGAIANPSTRFVNSIVYASVCIVGALYVVMGYMSVGALSSFLSYANQYTKPFNEISNVITELQTAIASTSRIFELLDTSSESVLPVTKKIENVKGHVLIQNLSFSYVSHQPFIENFQLEVKPGEMIAIVGPTGCGKTTLINLLMRFYEPQKGKIEIDGINIQDMSRDDLRSMFGMVLQESWLFSGTIRDNLTYGRNISDEEVMNALKNSHADKFVMQLKDGIYTYLSENGGNLSLGQKQLLCIARIMLLKPKMLILDEATSSIDTRTEKQIQDAFDCMMEGKTTFIVAHRLSTIQKANQILVMNHGQIVEKGNHEELLLKKGFYYHLYKSQFEQ